MCCLWPISLHFVYTAFFESDTHRPDSLWWKPCTTSSPLASRGSRCHRVTLGAEHLGQQSLQDAAAWLVSAGGTGLVPSSSKLPSSPPSPRGSEKRKHGAQRFQPPFFVPAPALASHLPTSGNLKAHPQAQEKAFRPITKGTTAGNSLKWFLFCCFRNWLRN